jgi:hypothetical protein
MEIQTVLVYSIVTLGLGMLAILLWVNLYNKVRRLEVEV